MSTTIAITRPEGKLSDQRRIESLRWALFELAGHAGADPLDSAIDRMLKMRAIDMRLGFMPGVHAAEHMELLAVRERRDRALRILHGPVEPHDDWSVKRP